jgi:hypothetical protein
MEKKLKDSFYFLIQEYGFRLVSNIIDKDYCIIIMKNDTTGISINYELREDDIIVYLYRLIDGNIIEDKVPISSDIPLNCIELRYIVQFNRGETVASINRYADKSYDDLIENIIYDLKNYAEDVLKGNFDVFIKVDAMAKKRRLEWQNS